MDFQKGEKVGYLTQDCNDYILATIIDIHYDDKTPYYTVRTRDNFEINTVEKRLFKLDTIKM